MPAEIAWSELLFIEQYEIASRRAGARLSEKTSKPAADSAHAYKRNSFAAKIWLTCHVATIDELGIQGNSS